MALDAYVMPLWRFKAGNFTSPIEASLGVEPTIVSPDSLPPDRPPWYLRWLEKIGVIEQAESPAEPSPEELNSVAIREVDDLKALLTKMTGTPVEWRDEGRVHYKKQFHDPSVLRTFSAWCDHQDVLPEFQAAPRLRYDQHPVWKLPKPAHRRFSLLAEHSLFTGYLIPVDFQGVHRVEPFRSWGNLEFHRDVASTQAIARELTELLEFLRTVPQVREPEHGSIPTGDARWYAEELQRMCALSIEHRLPVIFYG